MRRHNSGGSASGRMRSTEAGTIRLESILRREDMTDNTTDQVVIARVEHELAGGVVLTETVLGGEQPHTQGKPGPVKRLASPYRGVSFHSCTQRWRGRIKHGSKSEHLGYYTSDLEAAKAYNVAARNIHGINAQVNEGVETVTDGTGAVRSRLVKTDRVSYDGESGFHDEPAVFTTGKPSKSGRGARASGFKRERFGETEDFEEAAPLGTLDFSKRPCLMKRESDVSMQTVDLQSPQFHYSDFEEDDSGKKEWSEEPPVSWEDSFVEFWFDDTAREEAELAPFGRGFADGVIAHETIRC